MPASAKSGTKNFLETAVNFSICFSSSDRTFRYLRWNLRGGPDPGKFLVLDFALAGVVAKKK